MHIKHKTTRNTILTKHAYNTEPNKQQYMNTQIKQETHIKQNSRNSNILTQNKQRRKRILNLTQQTTIY